MRRSRTSISTSRVVLKLFLRRARGLRTLLVGSDWARRVVVAGFVVLFGLIVLAEYALFRRSLEALLGLGLAGTALSLYFVETLLVLILVLSLVSYVASGLWIFYRAHDTGLLLASPLPLGGLYCLRTLETFALTAWAQVVVGLPALLALGVAHRREPAFYAYGAAVLVLFTTLVGALGALLTTVAGTLFQRSPTRVAVGLTVGALIAVFALVVGRNVLPSLGDFYAIFEPGLLNGKPASIKFIEAKFALWPSHPFAAALHAAPTGVATGSAATRTALWLLPLGGLLVAGTAARALYRRALPAIAESFVVSGRTAAPSVAAPARPFPRRLRGAIGALVERDLFGIARNPHELSRAAFIAFLLLLYTSFVFVAPLREAGDRPETVARLLLLNVLASGYFLTAFGLRVVFPSVSLEGRAAWVLFSSPVSLVRLFAAKLALYATLQAVVVLPIALVGTLRLATEPALVATTAALLLMLDATTTAVLLACGAAWPNFRESNPDSLSTSAGGFLATLACLAYVAFVAWVCRGAALATGAGGSVLPWLAAGALVSAALLAASIRLAVRRLRVLEVS